MISLKKCFVFFILYGYVNANDILAIIGGKSDNHAIGSSSVEILSLGNQKCSTPPELEYKIEGMVGTVLDSKMMVCGGYSEGCGSMCYHSTCYNFNSSSNMWVTHESMISNHSKGAAFTTTEGEFFVDGGYGGGICPLNATESYSNDTTWKSLKDMPSYSKGGCMVTLNATHIMYAGGEHHDQCTVMGHISNSVFLYDSQTDTWSNSEPMNSKRGYAMCSTLPGGEVIIAGGKDDDGGLKTVEVYNPSTETWTYTTELPMFWYEGKMVVVNGSPILVTGVTANTKSEAPNVEERIFSLIDEEWVELEVKLSSPKSDAVVLVVPTSALNNCYTETSSTESTTESSSELLHISKFLFLFIQISFTLKF